ncbi:hypothetical protein [Devosia insulae]|jgi:hypothetical protein|uniref:hypothetical protein n=1 Tax=Devosia insulae TaxID=408174 RepID=UPI00114D2D21|nr:hypothetical protein [Devosia insulae]
MPDLDLEPHQYRRNGTYSLRDMGWLATLAVPPGILAPFLAAGVLSFFPPVPQWVAWGLVLAPGIALIVLHEALDGTRIKRATEAKDRGPAKIGRSKAGTTEDVPHARLPK